MPGGGEKAFQRLVRNDERRGVYQRMRVHGVGVPQPPVDDELDGVLAVVDKCEQAHRSWCYPEMALQPVRRREAQSPGTDRCTQRTEVDDEIVRHCHQKMSRALLVAEE